jgi:DnaK suppressor protein
MPDLKPSAHANAELTAAQLCDLAERMTGKRRELVERARQLEQQMATSDDCSLADAADAASAQEDRLRARAMLEQHQQAIGEIDAALRRLEIGTYGVSDTTGEPISYQRLALVPWARTDIDHKEQ